MTHVKVIYPWLYDVIDYETYSFDAYGKYYKALYHFKRQFVLVLFFCLLLNLIVVLLTYFLSAYSDNPKHANVVHSISIYTPTPIKHPLLNWLSTNVAKNELTFMLTKLCTEKKKLKYSIFTRNSKQFIVLPYLNPIKANKCQNISMRTHRA